MATLSVPLPSYPLLNGAAASDPMSVVTEWAARAEPILRGPHGNLGSIFVADAWWRDSLSVSWDLRTLQGLDKIQNYLQSNPEAAFLNLSPTTADFTPVVEVVSDSLTWICAVLTTETNVGRGQAVVRLVKADKASSWKALYMYTALEELKGCEEPIGARRPQGGNLGFKGESLQPTWLEKRERQKEFADEDPTVLIIGAGQAGLSLAAQLQSLGLKTLIVEKNARVGDNWRMRYKSLVTHDPISVCHLPYLPFPVTWPLYTSKDKLGDWLEMYASVLELNVWVNSTIESCNYDDEEKQWEVVIHRADAGTEPVRRTLKTGHVVMATGHAGEPRVPTYPGQSDFKGLFYHASSHRDASNLGIKGKNVVVVGTGNTGHDVAQNFFENGANVTLLQRGGTAAVSAANSTEILFRNDFNESREAPPVEIADLMRHSLPIPVGFTFGAGATKQMMEADAALLGGLTKAGFQLDFGVGDAGAFQLYLTRGGGYYIDVGCSQLIIDGDIKVKSCPQGIRCLDSKGLVLADDSRLDADVIVLATGYDNMRTTVRKVLGDSVADQCKDIWDLDEEGELHAVWRPSGHPRFWYMAGNLLLCRPYSKTLALQIKAVEMGLNKL